MFACLRYSIDWTSQLNPNSSKLDRTFWPQYSCRGKKRQTCKWNIVQYKNCSNLKRVQLKCSSSALQINQWNGLQMCDWCWSHINTETHESMNDWPFHTPTTEIHFLIITLSVLKFFKNISRFFKKFSVVTDVLLIIINGLFLGKNGEKIKDYVVIYVR